MFGSQDVEALVIGLPGIVKDGIAIWCSNLEWKDFKAEKAFEGLFKNAPVLIENDANLAGLAETRLIDPIPVSALYVTIITGIGTGVITNGHIDTRAYATAKAAMLSLTLKVKCVNGKALLRVEQFTRHTALTDTKLPINQCGKKLPKELAEAFWP
jgi:predicted NBD/HSP70 family sugar kinase